MKAIILAAGIASRLRPLTDTQPKCLRKIGKRCLLERTMDALISNNIKEFIIVTGYRQQQIIDFLQKRYPLQNITFIYNERYASTNNIYSLWLTAPQTTKEDILLLDAEGKIIEISKTCSISQAMGESIGIEKMSAAYTDALFQELDVMIRQEKLDNIFYEGAFERLIPQGYSFYTTDTSQFFSIELDTVEDFHQAQQLIPSHLY